MPHSDILGALDEGRKDLGVAVFREQDVRILRSDPVLEHEGLSGVQSVTRGAGSAEEVFSFEAEVHRVKGWEGVVEGPSVVTGVDLPYAMTRGVSVNLHLFEGETPLFKIPQLRRREVAVEDAKPRDSVGFDFAYHTGELGAGGYGDGDDRAWRTAQS
jgi:hypothetical protein